MGALHHGTVAAPNAAQNAVAPPVEVRPTEGGHGVFATRLLPSGTRLFDEKDWTEDAERRRFSSLSGQQLAELAPHIRGLFLRFAYNASPDQVRGTFHPEMVKGFVNFINHGCDPNAGYDGAGHIVALTRIKPGEEVRIDYGTFTFSFDHEFDCRCGAPWCRRRVTHRDWPELVRAGLRLPRFMATAVSRTLWGERAA